MRRRQKVRSVFCLMMTAAYANVIVNTMPIDIASAMALWILGIGTSCGVLPPKYNVEPLRKLVFAGLPLELYEFLSRGLRNNKKLTIGELFCYWWSQRDLGTPALNVERMCCLMGGSSSRRNGSNFASSFLPAYRSNSTSSSLGDTGITKNSP